MKDYLKQTLVNRVMNSDSTTETTYPQARKLPIRILIAVFCVLWFILVTTASSSAWHNDGWVRWLVAGNLVHHGDPILREAESGEIDSTWAVVGKDGHLYSAFGIASSLIMIPFYALADWIRAYGGLPYIWDPHRFLLQQIAPIQVALTGLAIFYAASRLGYRLKASFLLAIVVSFTTILWPHSRDIHDHVQETLLVTASLSFIVAPVEKPLWAIFVFGMCLGLGFATRTSAALAGPGLMLVLVGPELRNKRFRRIALWLAVFFSGVIATGWLWPAYNYMRFGNLLANGYEQQFARGQLPLPVIPTPTMIAAWFVSPQCGALLFMPVLLLVPLFAGRFAKQHPWVPAGGVLTFCLYVIFHASFPHLVCPWTYGPNNLMATIPWFLLPIVVLFEEWSKLHPALRSFAVGIIVLSLLAQLPGVFVASIRTWYRVKDPHQWNWEWGPIWVQARDSLMVIGNVLSGKKFDLTPNPATMLDTYFELNVPDWWWLFIIYRGFRPALIIPVTLLGLAGYIASRLLQCRE